MNRYRPPRPHTAPHTASNFLRCEDSTRQYLLDIRTGKFSYEQIMADVEKRMDLLVKLRGKGKLPSEPDMKSINRLFMEIAR